MDGFGEDFTAKIYCLEDYTKKPNRHWILKSLRSIHSRRRFTSILGKVCDKIAPIFIYYSTAARLNMEIVVNLQLLVRFSVPFCSFFDARQRSVVLSCTQKSNMTALSILGCHLRMAKKLRRLVVLRVRKELCPTLLPSEREGYSKVSLVHEEINEMPCV